jgi:hypothetical protein
MNTDADKDLCDQCIPDNILEAMKSIVEWAPSYDPDDDRLLAHDIPVMATWLEQLGLISVREILERTERGVDLGVWPADSEQS